MSKSCTSKSVLRKIFTVLGIILCVVLIPVLIINVTLIVKSFVYPDKVPDFLGYKPFIVLSGSMEPVFYPGDMVLVREVDPAELRADVDIIAFRRGESVITHRITGIAEGEKGREFTTKGDNNNVEDNFKVTPNMIEGIYLFRIAKIGNAALFLQTPLGLVLFIALPLILFILYDMLRRQTWGKKAGERTQELEAELEAMRAKLAAMDNQPEGGEGAVTGSNPAVEEVSAVQGEKSEE